MMNKDMQLIKRLFPIKPYLLNKSAYGDYLSVFQSQLYFHPPLTDRIWVHDFARDKTSVAYRLDFGVELDSTAFLRDLDLFYAYEHENNPIFVSFCQTDDYLFISFSIFNPDERKPLRYFYFIRKSDRLVLGAQRDQFKDDLLHVGFYYVINATDSYFYSLWNGEEFREQIRESGDYSACRNLEQIASSDNGNPVIIKYFLKK